jgi:hypothetical protein
MYKSDNGASQSVSKFNKFDFEKEYEIIIF